MPPPSSVARAAHEAGHAVIARTLGFRIYSVTIEAIDENVFGLTITGKPALDRLEAACADLPPAARFQACRAYAQVAIAGSAAELVDQRQRGQALLAPMPCSDAASAESYLRFGTSRGRLREGALPGRGTPLLA